MNAAERGRLLELLGKQLLAAKRSGNQPILHNTWKLLWAMGAQVLVHDDGDFHIISPK